MLAWSNMRNANLIDADFEGAFLSEVDFRGAVLDGAKFFDACLLPVYAEPEQFRNSIGLATSSVDIHRPDGN